MLRALPPRIPKRRFHDGWRCPVHVDLGAGDRSIGMIDVGCANVFHIGQGRRRECQRDGRACCRGTIRIVRVLHACLNKVRAAAGRGPLKGNDFVIRIIDLAS